MRWAAEQIRGEFSEGTWGVFWQAALDGLPVAEVGEATGRSPGAIYVARYRVIARLKEKVLEVSQPWNSEGSER